MASLRKGYVHFLSRRVSRAEQDSAISTKRIEDSSKLTGSSRRRKIVKARSNSSKSEMTMKNLDHSPGQRHIFIGPSGWGKTWRMAENVSHMAIQHPNDYNILISPNHKTDKTWKKFNEEYKRFTGKDLFHQSHEDYSEDVRRTLNTLIRNAELRRSIVNVVLDDMGDDHRLKMLRADNPVKHLFTRARNIKTRFYSAYQSSTQVPKDGEDNAEHVFVQKLRKADELKYFKKTYLGDMSDEEANRIITAAWRNKHDSLYIHRPQGDYPKYYRIKSHNGKFETIPGPTIASIGEIKFLHFLSRTVTLDITGSENIEPGGVPGRFTVTFDRKITNVVAGALVSANIPRTWEQINAFADRLVITWVDSALTAGTATITLHHGNYTAPDLGDKIEIDWRAAILAGGGIPGEFHCFYSNVRKKIIFYNSAGGTFAITVAASDRGLLNILGLTGDGPYPSINQDIPTPGNENVLLNANALVPDAYYHGGANVENVYIRCPQLFDPDCYSTNSEVNERKIVGRVSVPYGVDSDIIDFAPQETQLLTFVYDQTKIKVIDKLEFQCFAHIRGTLATASVDYELDFNGCWPSYSVKLTYN